MLRLGACLLVNAVRLSPHRVHVPRALGARSCLIRLHSQLTADGRADSLARNVAMEALYVLVTVVLMMVRFEVRAAGLALVCDRPVAACCCGLHLHIPRGPARPHLLASKIYTVRNTRLS